MSTRAWRRPRDADAARPDSGTWRITATFTNAAFNTATASRAHLIGLASPVRLTVASTRIVYGSTTRLTTIVGGWAAGHWVYLYRTPAGAKSAKQFARLRIARSGRATLVVKPLKRTVYYAVYPGDATHRPGTSRAVTVGVKIRLLFRPYNAIRTQNGVAIFKYRAACATNWNACPTFVSRIIPALTGVPMTYTAQGLEHGRWVGWADTYPSDHGWGGIQIRVGATVTRYRPRINVKAQPALAYGLLPNTSPWIAWRVVR